MGRFAGRRSSGLRPSGVGSSALLSSGSDTWLMVRIDRVIEIGAAVGTASPLGRMKSLEIRLEACLSVTLAAASRNRPNGVVVHQLAIGEWVLWLVFCPITTEPERASLIGVIGGRAPDRLSCVI